MHLNGENWSNGQNMQQNCWELENGQIIYVCENNLTPMGCLPLPRGEINVFGHVL